MPLHNCPWCPQKFRDPSYYLRHIMGHREVPLIDRVKESNIIRVKYDLPTVSIADQEVKQ